MTNKNAKEILEDIPREGLSNFELSALDVAIEALGRRTPIRPIDGMSCPCGGSAVDRWSVYEFCPRCGQALDWSDKDE